MSKATEDALSDLHGTVAQVLSEVVAHEEEEVTYDEEGNAQPTGNMIRTVTPAMMATAVKFLKDNQITCDIDQDENMNNLRDTLAKKQKRSRLEDPSKAAGALQIVK